MLGSIKFDVEVYSNQGNFRGIKRYPIIDLLQATFKWDFHYKEDKAIFNNIKSMLEEEWSLC